MLSDVPSGPRFLVDVFSFVAHAEFKVGVLAPEDFHFANYRFSFRKLQIFISFRFAPFLFVNYSKPTRYTSLICMLHQKTPVKLTILEAIVKGYHDCSLAVGVGEKFIIKRKRGDRDPGLKVTDDGRGQGGQLQLEVLPVLACFPVLIVSLSILNHSNNKD